MLLVARHREILQTLKAKGSAIVTIRSRTFNYLNYQAVKCLLDAVYPSIEHLNRLSNALDIYLEQHRKIKLRLKDRHN